MDPSVFLRPEPLLSVLECRTRAVEFSSDEEDDDPDDDALESGVETELAGDDGISVLVLVASSSSRPYCSCSAVITLMQKGQMCESNQKLGYY